MILSLGFVWLFFSYISIKKGMHPFFRNTPEPKFKDYMTWDIWLIIAIGIFMLLYPLLEVWFWVYFVEWF